MAASSTVTSTARDRHGGAHSKNHSCQCPVTVTFQFIGHASDDSHYRSCRIRVRLLINAIREKCFGFIVSIIYTLLDEYIHIYMYSLCVVSYKIITNHKWEQCAVSIKTSAQWEQTISERLQYTSYTPRHHNHSIFALWKQQLLETLRKSGF